jgi:hypothetical protein
VHTQPHHQINHTDVFLLTVLTTVTLASSNSALRDDGDHTETCRNGFNVNFNIPFKAIFLCTNW